MKAVTLITLAAGIAFMGIVPVATGDTDCEGPYCCDRNPAEIVFRYLERGVGIVQEAIDRAGESAGKVKCTAYEVAFLCSDETFPPVVSPYRTNPTNVHGHYSPCFEVFTPGFEYMAGCPTAHALRHAFSGSSDAHSCIPLERIILPS